MLRTMAIIAALLVQLVSAWARADEPAPRAQVMVESLEVSPGLSSAVVSDALRARLARRVGGCKAAGQRDPGWSARITFSILADGSVVGLKVSEVARKASHCVERALRSLKFSAPGRSVTVEGQLHFGESAKYLAARKAGLMGLLGSRECPDGLCIDVRGPIGKSRRQIEGGIRARSKLRDCLRDSSEQVTLDLRLGGGGRILATSIKGKQTPVAKCVVRALDRVRFGTVKVRGTISVSIHRPLGGLMGNELQGGWGYGLPGDASGGTTWGTIGGLGKVGTGGGTGSGYGRGAPAWRPTQKPRLRLGKIQAVGPIAREIVRRFVRRRIPALRYCYERELRKRSDLKGRVEIQILIGGNGRVVGRPKVAGGTNRAVHQCMAKYIARMKLPESKDHKSTAIRFAVTLEPATR